MGRKSSHLLLDEPPLVLQQGLAVKLGLNKAIAVQKVHYWIQRKKEQGQSQYFKDGHWWIYNSYSEWQERSFKFWSPRTVRRIFKKLESEDEIFISTDKYNKENYDKTKWYTIDYEKLEQVLSEIENEEEEEKKEETQNRPTGQNGQGASGQSDQGGADNLSKPTVQSGRTNTIESNIKSNTYNTKHSKCAREEDKKPDGYPNTPESIWHENYTAVLNEILSLVKGHSIAKDHLLNQDLKKHGTEIVRKAVELAVTKKGKNKDDPVDIHSYKYIRAFIEEAKEELNGGESSGTGGKVQTGAGQVSKPGSKAGSKKQPKYEAEAI